ncbi:sensor domain-containing diguanylate cyclase [Photobacterium sp. SDRW27]|uniref:sensor domain-containing diguanylate cyclase n=1 Tax=Photobacterium obscurum TaxID=2829490 RepID=UPI0022439D8A|nr:sensor domain-containing diguanylate cyclase [Photobacterium obscurum]MCW8328858.1 sensor domain-containing diguanylate cyclase [Photobacterium obscurum]
MSQNAVVNEQLLIESHYGVVVHRGFKPLYADDNYARYFGYQSGQDIVALSSLLPLIAPTEQSNALLAYEQVMAGKLQPGVRTYKNIDNQGHELIVLTVDHVIEWQGEKAMQVTIVDLSPQAETQRQLQASEERYRALVDGSIQGIFVHKNFRPLFCNKAYAQMLGFADEQALMEQHSILPMIASDHHLQAHKDNYQLLAGNKDFIKTEAQSIRFDGSPVWMSLLSRPIQWDGETVVQVTAMDITEQQLLRQRLEHRANYDGLTNVLNRRAAMELLGKHFAHAQLHGNPFCCVLIDFDNFKSINDRYGHHMGDEVLREFATHCKTSIRKNDVIGRWGGEEFVLIFPDTDLQHAATIAERICDGITRLRVSAGSIDIGFSVSMGVSSLSDETSTVEQLLSNADNALYQAKHQGKSRVVIAGEDIDVCAQFLR